MVFVFLFSEFWLSHITFPAFKNVNMSHNPQNSSKFYLFIYVFHTLCIKHSNAGYTLNIFTVFKMVCSITAETSYTLTVFWREKKIPFYILVGKSYYKWYSKSMYSTKSCWNNFSWFSLCHITLHYLWVLTHKSCIIYSG